MSAHARAIFQAFFVTVLWSSSWVFIKIGLQGIPPITFAGFRYLLGFLLLLPIALFKDRAAIRNLSMRHWSELLALGLVMYVMTQGAQFLSLKFFPSVFIALVLNFTPVLVAVLSFVLLREKPTAQQLVGITVCLLGAGLYFVPHLKSEVSLNWLLMIPVIGMIANSGASIMGRAINRREHLDPRIITVVSMGVGSAILVGVGLVTEPFPILNTTQILIILWLAGINTAFAFTLWNHTLRSLSSVESSVINNTMMIQIAVLAVFVLGEELTMLDVVALVIASIGALLVQLRKWPIR